MCREKNFKNFQKFFHRSQKLIHRFDIMEKMRIGGHLWVKVVIFYKSIKLLEVINMIINCRECGREISDTAKQCPYCGAKVKREKHKKDNGLTFRIKEKLTNNKHGKVIYLCSLTLCCSIAIVFLFLTLISFFVPKIFFHSESYSTLLELTSPEHSESHNKCSSFQIEEIEFVIQSGSSNNEYLDVFIDGRFVEYEFYPDGKIEARFYAQNSSDDYFACFYDVKGTSMVFDYATRYLLPVEIELSDSCIELAPMAIDYFLMSHEETFDFNTVLSDYADYHDTLKAIKISSIILMSIFSVISICGIALSVKIFGKKKSQEN